MRRLVIVEALDSGFVVRASGDAGKVSKSVASVDDVVSFLRWYMTRPADAEAGAITFPMMALRETVEVDEVATALIPKTEGDLRPTDATVRVARPDPPPPITQSENPIPQPGATTRRIAPARWARPK
jgi:hypothetical protein